MDQAPLVEGQLNDGQKLLNRLAETGDAIAGGWVKEPDRWQWRLYLVMPLVSPERGMRPAYRRVREAIQTMPTPFWIDSTDVSVVGPSDPVGKAILDAQPRHSGGLPSLYGGAGLGHVSVDSAYIYAPPVVAAER
jgi:hypothetical protein